jgi:magnesium-transporting ATPase (P-type)
MQKPPRRSNRLLDVKVLSRALYLGVIVSIAVLLWAFGIWTQAGWAYGQKTVGDPIAYARGTTAVMVGIMGAQLGNLFASRTDHKSAFKLTPFRNKWLFLGILSQVVIMAAIVYVPFVQPLFSTAPLTPSDLVFLYALGPGVFLLEEVRKWVMRRTNR